MREHAMGVAASMLQYMKPEERNFLGMVNVAEGLIRYYREGPPNGQPGGGSEYDPGYARVPSPEQQQLPPQGAAHPDDDIPF